MNSDKMKPIVPIPKRVNGFSIDSIMRRDDGDRPANSSDESEQGDEVPSRQTVSPEDVHRLSIASRIPPLHPALPAHVKQLLLHGSASDASRRLSQDLHALQSQAWAYGNPAMGAFPTLGVGGVGLPSQLTAGLQQTGSALHPGLLAASRDPFSMYPWMLNRQSPGMFGLPYGHPDTGMFYHPYRKPKRIRTAFSPSQLLKLEHAFEKNHYVVGQERKELASKLSLTETQVKVWFQNRRTKHKRVRSDDEADPENGNISIDDDDIATTSYSDAASSYDDKEHGESESVRQCS